MVLLIGNYAADRQQSMQRFGSMMFDGLTAAGVSVELIQPEAFLGNIRFAGGFIAKWLAYVDKFVIFPRRLRARLRSAPAVVHICDHSNAMYAQQVRGAPIVVTCHDMLAVRGALGEKTDTPASKTGRWLQRWILAGLEKVDAIACVSRATCSDVAKLVARRDGRPQLRVVPLGLSYPFRKIARAEAEQRLRSVAGLRPEIPYVLHVGSNLRRKNRDGVLRIFARCKDQWTGQLVFAGEPLDAVLMQDARELGITDRIVQVREAESELLEALYNCAGAFLFPSRFEGFGWPIIEAQACGCSVLTSAKEPMSDVTGASALLRDPADEEGFAADLIRLLDAAERERWSAKSLENARRFTTARMISSYQELYRSLAPVC